VREPSLATDDVDALREHFHEDQIVRIVGVIAISEFMNRWNTTVATTLEDLPRVAAETRLAGGGWTVGVHG
jgi:alkylhydroperoxidase family enzyme